MGIHEPLEKLSIDENDNDEDEKNDASKIEASIDNSSDGKADDLSDRMIAALKHAKRMDKSGETTPFQDQHLNVRLFKYRSILQLVCNIICRGGTAEPSRFFSPTPADDIVH